MAERIEFTNENVNKTVNLSINQSINQSISQSLHHQYCGALHFLPLTVYA